MLFTLYFIIAGIERFLIEHIRVNNLYDVFGFKFTQAELLSTLMVVAGIVITIILYKRKDKIIAKYGNSAAAETVDIEQNENK